MSSFLSKLTLAATAGLGAAFSTGMVSPKVAAWIGIGAAVASAFQKPVQQSQTDNQVANAAIAANKPN